jgi:hypothetical protein
MLGRGPDTEQAMHQRLPGDADCVRVQPKRIAPDMFA